MAVERARECRPPPSYGGEEDGPSVYGFAAFQGDNPAREIFGRRGVLDLLDDAGSWEDLRFLVGGTTTVRLIVHSPGGRANWTRSPAAANGCCCMQSSSATDFAWLADEMDTAPNHECWVRRRFDVLSGGSCCATTLMLNCISRLGVSISTHNNGVLALA